MLSLDHSGGDAPLTSDVTAVHFQTVCCIRPVRSTVYDLIATPPLGYIKFCKQSTSRAASSAQGVKHTRFTNKDVSVACNHTFAIMS